MRIWEKEIIEAGSSPKKHLAYVVRCGAPGCNEMAVGGGTIGKFTAKDALPAIFGRKGWTIGTKEKHDRCPFHTRKHADGQRVLEEKVMKTAPVTHLHPVIPPDTPSPQDRRVIFAKLNEVYIDPDVGYADGWNDEVVAKDLGTPVAWVAEVREPNFGPNKSQQSAKLLEEGRALLKEAGILVERVDIAINAVRKEQSELAKLTLRIEKFDKDLNALAKRAGK